MSKTLTLIPAFGACVVLIAAGTSVSTEQAKPSRVANFITGEGLPNPTPNITKNWGELPAGRKWGTSAGIDIDPKDGNVWAYERCGAGTAGGGPVDCENNPVDPVFKFDRRTGKVLANIGKGVMVTPHGIGLDRDGNVWIADFAGNKAGTRGHQVHKFSPDGKLLMSLGKPGGNQPGQTPDSGSFYQPNDVITYPNGDILVAEGHGNAPPSTARLIRFDKSGKFLREFGKMGTGTDGEFMQPHGLAFDSRGRLFVADRNNNRIQILDGETYKTLDTWYQFSRLSGIFIDRNDMVYGADSESGSVNPPHGAWMRGIRIGSAKDGKVTAFIPDPTSVGETFSMVDGKPVMKKADGSPGATGTLAAEGVAVDAAGNIYGAEVGPKVVKKYVKK
jgi:DNA-binding beta-propeller fold protein YncE